jgi:hypothetical protein
VNPFVGCRGIGGLLAHLAAQDHPGLSVSRTILI